MAEETKLQLEIAHVLFIDVVGYSKLLVKQQRELRHELNEVVSGTNEFRVADSAREIRRVLFVDIGGLRSCQEFSSSSSAIYKI